MPEWEEKFKRLFGNAVVNKRLMQQFENFKLPRFVSEYIVQMFIDEHGFELGVSKMEEFLNKHYPQATAIDYLHYTIQEKGEINIIDNFKVNIHIENHGNGHRLSIPSLNINQAQVGDRNIISDNPRLLGSGLWGMGKVTKADGANRVTLSKFKPFQVSSIDLAKFKELRTEFSTAEWLDLLISSIGLNPDKFTRTRDKLVILSRLLPLIQKSIFLFEFGRPGTGKTYIFDRLSSASFVISGSTVTPAKLFKDCNTKQVGLLKQYDAILFDEIDKVSNADFADEIINKLLRYMASSSFDRCGDEMTSNTSLIFSGNLLGNFIGIGVPKFLEPLAQKLKSEPFLDRFSGVIPGWEIRPFSGNSSFSSTYGFSADYFSAILGELRHEDWEAKVQAILEFSQTTNRDDKAIIKSVSGLLKLIFPHGIYDDCLQEVVDYATEMRQYIINERFNIHQNRDDDRQLKVNNILGRA